MNEIIQEFERLAEVAEEEAGKLMDDDRSNWESYKKYRLTSAVYLHCASIVKEMCNEKHPAPSMKVTNNSPKTNPFTNQPTPTKSIRVKFVY